MHTRTPCFRRCLRVLVGLSISGIWTTSATFIGFSSASAATPNLAAPKLTAPSLDAVLTKMKAAIAAQKSVQFIVAVNDSSSKRSEHVVANLGKDTGSQDLTLGTATAHIRVTKSNAYLMGNNSGLETFFQMPAADVTKVGSKWVSIKSGTSQYRSFLSAVTIRSLAANLVPTTKTVQVKTGKVNGVSVYVLQWAAKVNGRTTANVLNIASKGAALPVSSRGAAGAVIQTMSFGQWGETISVGVPTNTISITSLK